MLQMTVLTVLTVDTRVVGDSVDTCFAGDSVDTCVAGDSVDTCVAGDSSGSSPPQSHPAPTLATPPTHDSQHAAAGAGGDRPRGKGRPAKGHSGAGRYGVHCPVCSKVFNNSSALAKHKLTHSDERKYACLICSKAFKRQDHL